MATRQDMKRRRNLVLCFGSVRRSGWLGERGFIGRGIASFTFTLVEEELRVD